MKKHIKKHTRVYAAFIVLAVFVITNTLVARFANAQSTTGATPDSSTTTTADTKEPSDVENLKATPGDSEITLTWDSATDDTKVVGYKIYRGTHSVQKTEDRYDLPVVPVGDVQSYTVKNLTNGQPYYFTITALDAAGNESSNYATEVSATPQQGLHAASIEDNGKAPQVTSVTAEDNITVKVVFSEPIKLPEEHPASAFQIEKISDKSRLDVQNAQMDDEDSKGQTVILTTAPQMEESEYVLTAGIEIQDYYNNPVISGTSDTGSFKGAAKKQQTASIPTVNDSQKVTEPPVVADATSPLTITNAVADYNNRISVTFSDKVKVPSDAAKRFIVYKKDTIIPLKIINVSLSVDEKTIYITTDPQQSVPYDVYVKGTTDSTGNTIQDSAAKVTVAGNTTGAIDVTPPEDVTGLTAQIKDAKNNIIELHWKASKNSAGDLNDQLLYQSDGRTGAAYGSGSALGKDPAAAQVQDLEGGKWYTFKVTTKDTTGNESKGAVTSIYLPKTGPGMIAAGLTSFVMGLYSRRKKKHETKQRK